MRPNINKEYPFDLVSNQGTCECVDHLLNEKGEGDCQNVDQQGRSWCYVTRPSDCQDLVSSTVYPGRQWSFEACKQKGGKYYHASEIYI